MQTQVHLGFMKTDCHWLQEQNYVLTHHTTFVIVCGPVCVLCQSSEGLGEVAPSSLYMDKHLFMESLWRVCGESQSAERPLAEEMCESYLAVN